MHYQGLADSVQCHACLWRQWSVYNVFPVCRHSSAAPHLLSAERANHSQPGNVNDSFIAICIKNINCILMYKILASNPVAAVQSQCNSGSWLYNSSKVSIRVGAVMYSCLLWKNEITPINLVQAHKTFELFSKNLLTDPFYTRCSSS